MFRGQRTDRAQVFPLDLIPASDRRRRVGDAHRRSRSACPRAQCVPARYLLRAGHRRRRRHRAARARPRTGIPLDRVGCRAAAVRAHISGTDLVCDRAGNWMVLEDNLRIPSGIAYAIANRRLLDEHLPELDRPADLADVEPVPQMLLDTLRAAAPPRAPGRAVGRGAVRRLGRLRLVRAHLPRRRDGRPAWCSRRDLSVRDGKLLRHIGSDVRSRRRGLRPDGRGHVAVVHRPRRHARCGRACSRRSLRDVDHRQRARQRRRRRQGHLRLRAGDDRVLPRREAGAGPGADLDLRRTRPARLRARPHRRSGRQADRRVRRHAAW